MPIFGGRGILKASGLVLAVMIIAILPQPGSGQAANSGVYGCTGNDGAIVKSVDGTETAIVEATTYVVNSGITITTTSAVDVIFICATVSITINGTISANGVGGAGGNPGSAGGPGYGAGAGASGGTDGAVNGGVRVTPTIFTALYAGNYLGFGNPSAPGGGGGGAATCTVQAHSGGSGAGGMRSGGNSGGSGASSGTGGTDGAGGAGAGIIVLASPVITINGFVVANGTNGQNATGTNCAGGGGGAGGIVYEYATVLNVASGTHEYVTGGNGGAGGGTGGAGSGGGAGGAEDTAGGNGNTPTTGGGGGGGGSGGEIIRRIMGDLTKPCAGCESQSHANATWEGQANANATWEGQAHANSTWEGQSHANATWEGQAHANATWESQVHANATWCPLTGVGCSDNDSSYLPWAIANSTLEGQAHANATWCPYSCITTAEDWTNLTNGRQDAYGNATFEGQLHANATWCANGGVCNFTNVNVTYENVTYLNVTHVMALSVDTTYLNASIDGFEGAGHANATWCPLVICESQSHANATWEGQAHANATWCPISGVGCAGSSGGNGTFSGNFTGNFTIAQGGFVDGLLSFDWSQPFFAGITLAKAVIMLLAFAAFIWVSRLHWYEMAAWSWLIIIQQLFLGDTPFGPHATFIGLVVLWLVNLFLRVILSWRDELRQRASSGERAARGRGG